MKKSSWRGFSEGGTLRQLVERLSEFIMWDRPIPAHILGPWPDWVCGGDPWGYGDDMDAVRAVARALGLVEVPEADDTEAETPETAPAEVAE